MLLLLITDEFGHRPSNTNRILIIIIQILCYNFIERTCSNLIHKEIVMATNVINNDGLDRLVSKILQPDFKKVEPHKDPISWEELENYDETTPDGKASLEDQYIEQEKVQAMWDAVNDLPDLDKRILTMVIVDGQSQEAVASQVGMSQRGVSYRLEATLKHLRSALVDFF